MKKIISFVLAACLLLTCATAFAATEDKVFGAFKNIVYSGEFEMTVNAELNKPLEIATVIQKLSDESGIDLPLDFKMFLESIFNSDDNIKCIYNVSKDFKKADLYFDVTQAAPLEINEGLKISAWSNWKMWIKYDFTASEPVYQIIYKTPMSRKYIVMDMAEELKDNYDLLEKSLPDEEDYNETLDNTVSLYKDNYKVSAKGGKYILKTDDKGFKNILIGVLNMCSERVSDSLSESGAYAEEASAFLNSAVDSVKGAADKFSILGKDGISSEIKINPFGYITETKTSANIALNVYDILDSFGAGEIADNVGVTKDNGNIDFTVVVCDIIKKHNQNVKVDFPVLTEDNSVDILKKMQDDDDYFPEYFSEYNYFGFDEEGLPIIKNNTTYVELSKVADCCGFELTEADGKAVIDTKTSLGVIEIKEGENSLIKNGEVFEVSAPAISVKDKLYVNSEILSHLNVEISDIYYSAEGKTTNIMCCYQNPDYAEPEYEEYEEEYVSPYFYVETEYYPIIENNVLYIPLNPLLGEFNVRAEEISTSGEETVVESEEANGFKKLKVFENKAFAEKDDVKILFTSPAKNVDGTVWVGTDFAENVLGAQLTDMSYNDGRATSYWFYKEVK